MLFAGPRVLSLPFEDKYVSAYQRFRVSGSISFVRCQGFRTFPAALFSQIAHRRLSRRNCVSQNQLRHRLTKEGQRSLSLKLPACKLRTMSECHVVPRSFFVTISTGSDGLKLDGPRPKWQQLHFNSLSMHDSPVMTTPVLNERARRSLCEPRCT